LAVSQLHTLTLTLLIAALSMPGCDRCGSSKQQQGPASRAKSSRDGTHVLRSLLREAGRAELDAGGLLVDLGTPDQHKYIRGGWRTGWAGHRSEGTTTYLEATARATLGFHDWRGGVGSVVLRARSRVADQGCTLKLNDRDVGTRTLTGQWRQVDFPLNPPTEPGPLTLELVFAKGEPGAPAAQVDEVWLRRGREPSPPKPAKVAVLTFGEPRRALVATPPRTLAYHLVVPPQAALVFDYAAKQPTEFVVTAVADGSNPGQLFRAKSSGAWQEARVDLSKLAGRAVRLELTTRGAGGEAGWAEPDLVRSRPLQEARPVPAGQHARNLIHVLVDAARQDVYKPFNPKTRVDAPALSALAERSTIFLGAYTAANWTLPSVATIFSGRYFFTYMAGTETDRVPDPVPLLQHHLKRHGFATAAIVANLFISEPFGLRRGWDHFRNLARERTHTHAEMVFSETVTWLRNHKERSPKQRFYLYIHTMEPHDPYRHHGNYTKQYLEGKRYTGRLGPSFDNVMFERMKRSLTAEDRRYVRALYDGEVSFHDEHFGRLIQELERLDLLKDTMVVYSSDHGEEMFERGGIDHGHALYEEQVRVPLVIHYPQIFPGGRRVAELVELVDLAPTELEALGLPPLPASQGQSLIPLVRGGESGEARYTISAGNGRAVRLGQLKLIQWPGGRQALFDLAADPGERNDLAQSRPVALRTCEIHLGEGLAVPFKGRRTTTLDTGRIQSRDQATIDGELRKQLEALGYLE
jgi:choline-sulfatase